MTTVLTHDRVLALAAEHPDAVAVVDGQRAVTYGALVQRATAAAARLADAGVAGPDQVVGLTGPRSADGVAGLLGILLAGGAYLFLDAALPRDRARHMLDRCAVEVILAAGDAPVDGQGRRVVRVAAPPPHRTTPPAVATITPADLAYVIYTSGSTGIPKGVAIEHGGVANLVVSLADVLDVCPGTRVLQFSAWSWDAAAAEILMTLAAGGTLIVAPDAVRQGGDPLADFLRTEAVEAATLTPSVMATVVADDLPALRTVAAVGETCPPALIERWARDGRRVLNGYGPTEATVAVSVGACAPGEEVHVGPPLSGVDVRILDGILHVGGAGLARGYVEDLAATPPRFSDGDGRFLRDADGKRWFDTGDRVRLRGDGSLVHLGRVDDQVQVHGHRVELGEIEATLRRAPSVTACAVVVRGGRLVAFVTGDLAGLDDHARAWLPPHMVPELVAVDALPRTAGGKLDRAALTAASAPPGERAGLVAVVLDAVHRLLEDSAAGPDDDFFALGGHSLLAAELSVELAGRVGVDLPVLTIFDHPTAARLAAAIEAA